MKRKRYWSHWWNKEKALLISVIPYWEVCLMAVMIVNMIMMMTCLINYTFMSRWLWRFNWGLGAFHISMGSQWSHSDKFASWQWRKCIKNYDNDDDNWIIILRQVDCEDSIGVWVHFNIMHTKPSRKGCKKLIWYQTSWQWCWAIYSINTPTDINQLINQSINQSIM